MTSKTSYFTSFIFVALINILSAVEYEEQDIGLLQTYSSQGIALNNKGQILGWYNVDGSNNGKVYFVRDKDGVFHELPAKDHSSGLEITWLYLTDEEKAYGTIVVNPSTKALCTWDINYGFQKHGNLPGKEIAAINNSGQVLIKSITENENGKSIVRPVIWKNGTVTKLRGLIGSIGTESEESIGLDINNKGEVVGTSVVNLILKNEIYKQVHAVKWTNGHAVDLHNLIPKTTSSEASAINDRGDIIINGCLISFDGKRTFSEAKFTDKTYLYDCVSVIALDKKQEIRLPSVFSKIYSNPNSVWMSLDEIISVNDNGEIVADGTTIYGEKHIIFLVPAKHPKL